MYLTSAMTESVKLTNNLARENEAKDAEIQELRAELERVRKDRPA